MKIEFKTEVFDADSIKTHYVEHCVPVEEVESIYGFPDSICVTLKNGEELYADTVIKFVD